MEKRKRDEKIHAKRRKGGRVLTLLKPG